MLGSFSASCTSVSRLSWCTSRSNHADILPCIVCRSVARERRPRIRDQWHRAILSDVAGHLVRCAVYQIHVAEELCAVSILEPYVNLQSSLLFNCGYNWHQQPTNTYTVLQKVHERALFCLVVCKGGHATSQGACHAGVEYTQARIYTWSFCL